jgi:hypothetical protein
VAEQHVLAVATPPSWEFASPSARASSASNARLRGPAARRSGDNALRAFLRALCVWVGNVSPADGTEGALG